MNPNTSSKSSSHLKEIYHIFDAIIKGAAQLDYSYFSFMNMDQSLYQGLGSFKYMFECKKLLHFTLEKLIP